MLLLRMMLYRLVRKRIESFDEPKRRRNGKRIEESRGDNNESYNFELTFLPQFLNDKHDILLLIAILTYTHTD